MTDHFRLLMISAMYENGGNTTQRLLDGHPELISYPFESQLGTRYVQDYLSGLYPAKYRWPVFPLNGDAAQDYEAIIDEECKVRVKTRESSKFRDVAIDLDDRERKRLFLDGMTRRPRSTASIVESFFRATAEAWKDRARSGRESVFVGYSPIVGVDADRMLSDLPGAHVLNVVRHPWSGYAETKHRPVPLSIAHYTTGWSVHLQHALAHRARFPDRVHLVRYEDLIADPVSVLSTVLRGMGVGTSPTLDRPSWNGTVLSQVYPWGTIRLPRPEADRQTGAELTDAEKSEVRARVEPLLRAVDYSV